MLNLAVLTINISKTLIYKHIAHSEWWNSNKFTHPWELKKLLFLLQNIWRFVLVPILVSNGKWLRHLPFNHFRKFRRFVEQFCALFKSQRARIVHVAQLVLLALAKLLEETTFFPPTSRPDKVQLSTCKHTSCFFSVFSAAYEIFWKTKTIVLAILYLLSVWFCWLLHW